MDDHVPDNTPDKHPTPSLLAVCDCPCHKRPGIMHMMPCCGPGSMPRQVVKTATAT